ncbi:MULTISPECIES: ADP-ribosyltransferase domain-containing protein [Pseudomonas syringae group]|uniref:ADP-ribosyltransferase domain-containing protein n=1 Tax=Pseudomonas syringae group TaxID=136849 RepID=UPI000C0770CB|nr:MULTISPECIES: ADP-ribosyltransferase domain-containing protein [Pseudomonas syringae group]RMR27405.1 Type III effector HopS1 [Pseudomonas syringae pv. persicae]
MKISGSTSPANTSTNSAQKSSSKGLLSGLAKHFKGMLVSGNTSGHSALGHYASSSSGSKGKAPVRDDYSNGPQTRLNNTPLKRALARELDRFGYGSSATESFDRSLQRKDKNPELGHLDDDEYLALRMYTTPFYRAVNHQLRDGKPSEDMKVVVEAMNKGLKRLAEHPDNVVKETLYRGINKVVDDKFIHKNFKLGEVYRDKTFVSATPDLSTVNATFTRHTVKSSKAKASAPVYQRSPLLEIESRSAVRVRQVSLSSAEEEGIFAPDTPFLVADKSRTDSGRWHIKLKEIDESDESSGL